MTNISKRNLKTADYRHAYRELTKFIASLNKKNSHFFITELLTESEQIMLVKRFAAIFMFSEGYSAYRVSQALGVSESTAQRLHHQFENDHFIHLLNALPQTSRSSFLALLEDLILAQASPRARARIMNRVL